MSNPSDTDARTRASRSMDRYADGDAAAFDELYDALAPALLGFALRLSRSRPVAEDVVQQTFLLIHRSRPRWIRGAKVFPWAFAIAHHFFLDLVRGAGPLAPARDDGAEPPEPAAPGPAADDDLEHRRHLQALLAQVDLLPVKLRLAFQLVVIEGLSIAEAAEVLGITALNTKVRVHRAREALRRFDEARERTAGAAALARARLRR